MIKVSDSTQARKIIDKYKKYLTDFEVLKGDMDDVFLNITGKRYGQEEGAED